MDDHNHLLQSFSSYKRTGPKGKRWVAPPSSKRVDRDGNPQLVNGKPVWDDIVEFRDALTRDRFNTLILEMLGHEHPEAFA